jgi:hypothetical protein
MLLGIDVRYFLGISVSMISYNWKNVRKKNWMKYEFMRVRSAFRLIGEKTVVKFIRLLYLSAWTHSESTIR